MIRKGDQLALSASEIYIGRQITGKGQNQVPALGNRSLGLVDGGGIRLLGGRDCGNENLRFIDGPQGLFDQLQHRPVIGVGVVQC